MAKKKKNDFRRKTTKRAEIGAIMFRTEPISGGLAGKEGLNGGTMGGDNRREARLVRR